MIHVVKIGGNIIDNASALKSFLKVFASISGPKILIHGGGKLATEMANKMNVPQQMMNGRRITDQPTLDIITMVYGGLINKNLVTSLNAAGCISLGICGADGNSILANKRLVGEVDFGFVGDIQTINTSFFQDILDKNLCLVVAPITHDGKGQLLNTNADTMAIPYDSR